MNVRELIRQIRDDGVVLVCTQSDQLQVSGHSSVVAKWTPHLTLNKQPIIKELKLLPDGFEQRYRSMCTRWRYEPKDVLEGLEAARIDPAKALLCLLADERRTDEERAKWMDA